MLYHILKKILQMNKTITIFGGSGFIGKHIIRRLSMLGYKLIVPSSDVAQAQNLKIYGHVGQILILNLKDCSPKLMENIIQESETIINLKTIWIEKKEKTFERQIYFFNKNLIDIIKKHRNKNYIFFSGLGTSIKSKSKRTFQIAKSEEYVFSNLNSFSIIRPSIVIGTKDKFLSKLIPIFELPYFFPVFGKGKALIQPTYVDDVAYAIEKIITLKDYKNNIYELAGNNKFSYLEFYKMISKIINKKKIFINIPFFFMSIFAYIFEKLSLNVINREQLSLFFEDNVMTNKFLEYKDLEIIPQDIEQKMRYIIKKTR